MSLIWVKLALKNGANPPTHFRLTRKYNVTSTLSEDTRESILSLSFRMSLTSTSGLNSHAVGMAVARPLGFEIDFVRNPISGSAARFFVIILKFVFTPIFEIKVREKKFLDTKKISFSKPDFHKPTFI